MIRVNLAKKCQTVEEWRPVLGYEGMGLEVSADGRVRRYFYYRPQMNTNGYYYLSTKFDGTPVVFLIHRAVCMAFNGGPPFPGAIVRHLDGNCQNNAPDNLAWGTSKDNAADRTRHGMTLVGARSPNAKLTEEGVSSIRARAAAGETELQLATAFGVGETTICRAIKGETWEHNNTPTLHDGKARRGYAHRRLSDEQVAEIRHTCKRWIDCRCYADMHGVSPGIVYLIMRGKHRKTGGDV